MSDPVKIPDSIEMVRASDDSRKRRRAREAELYPARLEQWRKRTVDQLQGAKMTEVQRIEVLPPPTDEDVFMRRVLDERATKELMAELRVLGYVVQIEEELVNRPLTVKIGWR